MILQADARQLPLRDGCVQCVVTSPPYFGLRDYGTGSWVGGDDDCDHRIPATGATMNKGNNNREGRPFRGVCGVCGAERVDRQIGLESTPDAYVSTLVQVFREVKRVLKEDGVCWLNLGDSYANSASGRTQTGFNARYFGRPDWNDGKQAAAAATKPDRDIPDGLKPKDLLGIPWRVAFALQADGWYLRSDVIWHKPNPMPESVTDRPTKAHEYLFLLTKSERYFYDAAAIGEPVSAAMLLEVEQGYDGLGLKDYDAAGVQNPSTVKARIIANARKRSADALRLQDEMGMDAVIDAETNREAILVDGRDGADLHPLGPRGRHSLIERYRKNNQGLARGGTGTDTGRGPGRGDGGAPCNRAGQLTRNKRSVWTIPTRAYSGAHFATMPEKLVEPCILAGSRPGDLVLDPFLGSGTVGEVAERLGRRWVGCDLNPAYHALAKQRTQQRGLRWA